VRILQVVRHMNRAGVETWLMHVLRHIDRRQCQFDFLVHSDREYAYSAEIRALGGRLLPCPWPSGPAAYARRFGAILKHCGPYDVVHSHLNHVVGSWILRLAAAHRVPRRILHTHTARPPTYVPTLLRLADIIGRRLGPEATDRLAVSEVAAHASFGAEWRRRPNTRVLYCGIDLTPFEDPIDRGTCRRQLGIDDGAFVIGHVGRFVGAKNHEFLVRIAAAAVRMAADVRLLVVGDGPRRREIETLAEKLGIRGRVIFTGSRSDVPDLMMGCMDAFALPSRHEGLGLVAVEAQAAGLGCVIADTVPAEAVVCSDLVRRLPLSAPPETWAAALLAHRDAGRRYEGHAQARDAVRRSAFNIHRSVEALWRVYAPSSAMMRVE
jgi:glycosyltransferase involved in cell wall biosynthesis